MPPSSSHGGAPKYHAPKIKPTAPNFLGSKKSPFSTIKQTKQSRQQAKQQKLKYKSPKQHKAKEPTPKSEKKTLPVLKKGHTQRQVNKAQATLRRQLAKARQRGATKDQLTAVEKTLGEAIIRRHYRFRHGKPVLESPSQRRSRMEKRYIKQHPAGRTPQAERAIPKAQRKLYGINKKIQHVEGMLTVHGQVVQHQNQPGYLRQTSTSAPFLGAAPNFANDAKVSEHLHQRLAKLNKSKAEVAQKLENAHARRAARHEAKGVGKEGWSQTSFEKAITPIAATIGIPGIGVTNLIGRGGWAAVRAATSTPEGEAVLGQGLKAAGQAIDRAAISGAGKLAGERGSATLAKLALNVPESKGAQYLGKSLVQKPLRTLAKLALVGGTSYGIASHPEDFPKLIDAFKKGTTNPDETVKDLINFAKKSPEITYQTVKMMVEDPKVRAETLKGIGPAAFYSMTFPFLVGAEIAQHGPVGGIQATGKPMIDMYKEYLTPAMKSQWDEFQKVMERPGGGGAIIPLSATVPILGGMSKMLRAGFDTGLRVSGHPGLSTRPDLRMTEGQTKPLNYHGKGVVSIGQFMADQIAQLRGSKDVTLNEGERGYLLPKRFHPRESVKRAGGLAARPEIGEAYRSKKLVHVLEKTGGKYRKDPLFGYLVRLGAMKDAKSAAWALDRLRTTIRENPSNVHGYGRELPTLDALVEQLRGPNGEKRLAKVKRSDVQKYIQTRNQLSLENPQLGIEQIAVRNRSEQTELLLRDQGLHLPPAPEATPLPPEPSPTATPAGEPYIPEAKPRPPAPVTTEGVVPTRNTEATPSILRPQETPPVIARRQGQLDWANGELAKARERERRLVEAMPTGRIVRTPADLATLDPKEKSLAEAQRNLARAHDRYDRIQSQIDELGQAGSEHMAPLRKSLSPKAKKARAKWNETFRKRLDKAESRLQDAKASGEPQRILEAQDSVDKAQARYDRSTAELEGRIETPVGTALRDRVKELEKARNKIARNRDHWHEQLLQRERSLGELRQGGIETRHPLSAEESARWRTTLRAATEARRAAQERRDFLRNRIGLLNRERIRMQNEQRPAYLPSGQPERRLTDQPYAGPERRARIAADAQQNYLSPLGGIADVNRLVAEGKTPEEIAAAVGAERTPPPPPEPPTAVQPPAEQPAGLPNMHTELGPTPAKLARDALASAIGNRKAAERRLKAAESGRQQAKESQTRAEGKLTYARNRKGTAKRTLDRLRQEVAGHRQKVRDQDAIIKRAKAELSQAKSDQNRARREFSKVRNQEKGRADRYLRNPTDDTRAYIKSVGLERIDQAARDRGMDAPGFWAGIEEDIGALPSGMARGRSTITPHTSRGILAREGRIAMHPDLQHGVAQRLNKTITKVRATLDAINTLSRPINEINPHVDHTMPLHEVIRTLYRDETQKWVDKGLSPNDAAMRATAYINSLAFWNERGLTRTNDVLMGEARPQTAQEAGLMHDLASQRGDQVQADFESGVQAALDQVIVAGDKDLSTLGKVKGASQEVLDSPGWRVGARRDQVAFQARLNPFSAQFGAHKLTRWLNNSKLVASQWLLLHPAWALAQVWANSSLLTLAHPQSWVTRGYKDWIDGLDSRAAQEFLQWGGTPMHHIDYDLTGHTGLASLFGLNHTMQRIQSKEFWKSNLRGKNPMTVFFGMDVRQTKWHLNKGLYSKMKGEALKRTAEGKRNALFRSMTKRKNQMMLLLEDSMRAFGKKEAGKTQVSVDEAMTHVLKDKRTMEKFSDELHSFLGDYLKFNPEERKILANNMLFYGFMRHSLMLSLWTLPVKHPIRGALVLAAGHIVEEEQKLLLKQQTQAWLEDHYYQMLMSRNVGRPTPAQARAVAERAARDTLTKASGSEGGVAFPGNQIPFSMWGNFVIPGSDRVISLRRASFVGSSPIEALGQGNPGAVMAGFAPGPGVAAELLTGVNLYTGNPFYTNPNSKEVGPGFNMVPLKDWPKAAAAATLNFAAPLRYLSQAASKYPTWERTATSFPLPSPFPNVLPEQPFKYSDKIKRQQQKVGQQIIAPQNTPANILAQELFLGGPGGFGHVSQMVPVNAFFSIDKLLAKAQSKRSARDAARSKELDQAQAHPSRMKGYGGDIEGRGSSAPGYDLNKTGAGGAYKNSGTKYDIYVPPKNKPELDLGRQYAQTFKALFHVRAKMFGAGGERLHNTGSPTAQRQGPADIGDPHKGNSPPPVGFLSDLLGAGKSILGIHENVPQGRSQSASAPSGSRMQAYLPKNKRQQAPEPHLGSTGHQPTSFLGALGAGIQAFGAALSGSPMAPKGVPTRSNPMEAISKKQKKVVAGKLQKAVASHVKIDANLTPEQKTFAKAFAKYGHVSPRFAAAAVLYEGGHGGTDHNWVNIGWTGSGPAPITNDPVWNDPASAGKYTGLWLRGKWAGSNNDYHASPSIVAITKQKGDQAQGQAWAQSGWAASGASPLNTINQVQVSTKPIPKGIVRRAQAVLGKKETKKILSGQDQGSTQYQLQTNELFFDPGINLKDGQPTSAIGGHGDHVHFASSDPRSLLIAAKIAKKYGANVSENPAYGGVEPVHASGSYHYRSEKLPGKLAGSKLAKKSGEQGRTIGQAIDINGVDTATLAKINKELAARSGATGGAATGAVTGASSSAPAAVGAPSGSGVATSPPGGGGGGGGGGGRAGLFGHATRYQYFDPQARDQRISNIINADLGSTTPDTATATDANYGIGTALPTPEEDIATRYGF